MNIFRQMRLEQKYEREQRMKWCVQKSPAFYGEQPNVCVGAMRAARAYWRLNPGPIALRTYRSSCHFARILYKLTVS